MTGCGGSDGLDRQPVAGAVTLDGTPLATGTVRFQPKSNDAGTDTSAPISGGKYAFSRETGPVPGTYTISITSIEPPKDEVKQGMVPGDYRPPATKDAVPDKYNIKTTLEATVKAGQSEAIDFTLTSK